MESEAKVSSWVHPNSDAEQLEIEGIMGSVQDMYDTRNRTWHEFNDRTLEQYEDDNQKRINNYVEPREDGTDDWQTRGFEGITREKMFAFVSKIAMSRPKYRFKATKRDGFIDRTVAEICEDFYDYSWNSEDPTGVQFFFDAWAAAGSGTVVRWEGVEQTRETVEEFDSYDVTTGRIEGLSSREIVSDVSCKSRRVSLGNFLVSDWYQPDLQRQTSVCETFDMSRSDFERQYGHYGNADRVPEMTTLREWNGTRGFFISQWDSVPVDRVQVFHYYEKGPRTKFRIVANGVLILSTPIPRKDGQFPYSKGIFKPFADSNFFYGKALPDEIAGDQDIYNAFKNMVMDRAILYVQRPLIGSNLSEVENEVFKPNGILNVKGGELKTMDYAPPGAADIQILEYLRGSVNRQTSDAQQSGQAGSGVTAREIVIADENARKLAGVSRLFLEDFDLRAARLRTASILQFYFEPTRVAQVLDDSDVSKLASVYRSVTLTNRTLSDKRLGLKVIDIVGDAGEVPSRDELDVDEAVAKLQGFELEKLVVSAEYIRDFSLDVMIVPESSYEQSRSLELAMQNEYMMTVAKLFPQKLMEYQDVFFREFNDSYDKDMSEFERAPKGKPAQVMPSPNGKGGSTMGQQLMDNNMNSLEKATGAVT